MFEHCSFFLWHEPDINLLKFNAPMERFVSIVKVTSSEVDVMQKNWLQYV